MNNIILAILALFLTCVGLEAQTSGPFPVPGTGGSGTAPVGGTNIIVTTSNNVPIINFGPTVITNTTASNGGISVTGVMTGQNLNIPLDALSFITNNTPGNLSLSVTATLTTSNINANGSITATNLLNNLGQTNLAGPVFIPLGPTNVGYTYNAGALTNLISSAIVGVNNNMAIGILSLSQVTSGDFNTALGQGALSSLTGGLRNTAIGYNSGNLTQTITDDTTVGYNSGLAAGNNNTIIGSSSGPATAGTGSKTNVYIGYLAGSAIVSGSNNVDILNTGANLDQGMVRIGTAGNQLNAIIAGVLNVLGGYPTNVAAMGNAYNSYTTNVSYTAKPQRSALSFDYTIPSSVTASSTIVVWFTNSAIAYSNILTGEVGVASAGASGHYYQPLDPNATFQISTAAGVAVLLPNVTHILTPSF